MIGLLAGQLPKSAKIEDFQQENGQKIALVGVENWGKSFKQAGDLSKASEGVSKDDFKILMSHDPSHWEAEVKQDNLNMKPIPSIKVMIVKHKLHFFILGCL